MLTGDFGRKFAKLEVAVTDVSTGGVIVCANASFSPPVLVVSA